MPESVDADASRSSSIHDPDVGAGADGAGFTPRLALVPMSAAVMQAVLSSDWPSAESLIGAPFPDEWRGDGWQWLQPRLEESRQSTMAVAWGTRLARLSDGRPIRDEPVIAEVGFHGLPDSDGWVEIGYRVIASHRRQGLAHEAAASLIAWAFDQGVRGVHASISPTNVASRRVLDRLGFDEVGARHHDVLGEQIRFARSR